MTRVLGSRRDWRPVAWECAIQVHGTGECCPCVRSQQGTAWTDVWIHVRSHISFRAGSPGALLSTPQAMSGRGGPGTSTAVGSRRNVRLYQMQGSQSRHSHQSQQERFLLFCCVPARRPCYGACWLINRRRPLALRSSQVRLPQHTRTGMHARALAVQQLRMRT